MDIYYRYLLDRWAQHTSVCVSAAGFPRNNLAESLHAQLKPEPPFTRKTHNCRYAIRTEIVLFVVRFCFSITHLVRVLVCWRDDKKELFHFLLNHNATTGGLQMSLSERWGGSYIFHNLEN